MIKTTEISSFNPVFLVGTGNCGFELFVSLLDNHDEVLVMPYSLKFYTFFNSLNLKNENNVKNLLKIILNKTKLKRFKDGYHKIENPFWDNEENFNDLKKFNINIFEENFEKFFIKNKISRKNILIAIFTSYALAIGKDLNKIKTFFIDGMYNDNTKQILEDFNEAKFIYLMRDPRETYLSFNVYNFNRIHKMTKLRKVYENMFSSILINRLSKNYKLLKNLMLSSSSNVTVIKFEDIHLKKEQIMRDICKKYGFEFNENLLHTTIHGNQSISVSSFSSKAISDTSKKRTERFKKNLPFFNLILLEKIFFKTLKNHDYEIISKQNSFSNFLFYLSYIFPLKNEIIPSNLIFKVKYKEKIKDNIFFKTLKYFTYLLGNIVFYFINRFFFNYKFYSIRD